MSDALQALQDRIAAWRQQGAARLDPLRFHYLEALGRRLPGQPPAVQRLLQDQLEVALAAYAERLAANPRGRRAAAPPANPPPCTPLAQLNAQLRAAHPAEDGDELASVRRFRQAWERGRTEDQVEQAVARKPANAGPLNSHVLVLNALATMQALSPDYLRHFLVHVESLQWLEAMRDRLPQKRGGKAAGTPRGGRKRK